MLIYASMAITSENIILSCEKLIYRSKNINKWIRTLQEWIDTRWWVYQCEHPLFITCIIPIVLNEIFLLESWNWNIRAKIRNQKDLICHCDLIPNITLFLMLEELLLKCLNSHSVQTFVETPSFSAFFQSFEQPKPRFALYLVQTARFHFTALFSPHPLFHFRYLAERESTLLSIEISFSSRSFTLILSWGEKNKCLFAFFRSSSL